MNVLIVPVLALLSMLIFFIPLKFKGYFALLNVIIAMVLFSKMALQVFTMSSTLHYNVVLPFGNVLQFTIDPLTAFFILLINFTTLTGILYGIGYLKQYYTVYKPIKISIHYFSFVCLQYAMLFLCMFREATPFLIAWEIMSVSSFILVIFEGGKKNILKVGINYFIQMHIGLLFILAAFLWVEKQNGQFGFNALTQYFGTNSNFLVFVLFFIGFGLKAGFIPLHTWLPEAHPAAPAHVSGVMSGVMIKMGIYGILRVTTYLQTDLVLIGNVVLIVSLISGLSGIIFAVVQKDLKRMLAFSSIENIGIIGIGIGLGILGLGKTNTFLIVLGFTGALLHIVNHSLFKSLLFYGAGAVYTLTHTVNIDRLGGLNKKIPKISVLFLIGIMAACALPPLNGFISEFILFNGLYQGLTAGNNTFTVLILISILLVTLIGGISVFAFVRVYGIAFLGNKRDNNISETTALPKTMVISMCIVAIPIILIGLFAPVILKYLNFVSLGSFTLNQKVFQSPICFCTMQKVSLIFFVLIGLAILLFIIRKLVLRNRIIKSEPTWGCGYTAITPQHQYTTASYANEFANLVNYVVNVQKKYKPIDSLDIFPEKRHFEQNPTDLIKEKIIDVPTGRMVSTLRAMAKLQTGHMQHYVLYALLFLLFILLLTFGGII